jgi:1-acyl-sn-glycerol-3-phosphate acyltransferase
VPAYVMLMRYHSAGLKAAQDDPAALLHVHEGLARWECKVLASYRLLGEWDQCTIFEAPDNFKAYRGMLEHDFGTTADTEILPAVDYDLFSKLVGQEAGTEGPHPWQITWWAKLGRLGFRWHAYGRWVNQACKPLTITGQQRFRDIRGPCIVVANHTSHLDALVLNAALPFRVRWNIYSGAAADRWFIKGRKELVMQPWYQSLAMGTFPIQRGGGSKALEYPHWLLEQGCNLLIFPEGTRSTSRSMAKFRHGVSILALAHDVPVVPVFLTGLAALRPKGSREVRPGPAGAHILEPIRFAPGTAVPEATRILYDAMNRVHQAVALSGDDAARQDQPGRATASVSSSQASRS